MASTQFNWAAGTVFQLGSLPPQRRSAWLDRAEQQLRAIERLPAGWDSHGAGRPDARTIESAAVLLQTLACADPSLAAPNINPTPAGGVQFHWESGPRYFEIELIDPSSAQYYYTDRLAGTELEGTLGMGEELDDVLRHVHRVMTGS